MSSSQILINRHSDILKRRYQHILEWGFILAILITIFFFYGLRNYNPTQAVAVEIPKWNVDVFDIPKTEWLKKPPKPVLPKIPVAGEEMDLLDDVPIDFTDFNVEDLLAQGPYVEETEAEFPFYAVQEKPELIKRVAPKYPELAKKAGIEGTVVVKVLIDKKGNVEKVSLIKSIPMLDAAALTAAWQLKFIPGKQRDKAVKVWFSIPFRFSLK